jgi:hypothetical protein
MSRSDTILMGYVLFSGINFVIAATAVAVRCWPHS